MLPLRGYAIVIPPQAFCRAGKQRVRQLLSDSGYGQYGECSTINVSAAGATAVCAVLPATSVSVCAGWCRPSCCRAGSVESLLSFTSPLNHMVPQDAS